MTKPLAVSLAQALIRCPSVTPEEGGALAYLTTVLAEAGFEVHRPVFTEIGTPDIDNLYARFGQGKPYLLFAGHTDVVPTGAVENWSHDPFAAQIENGELYGRGAVDMKGGIACMVAATLDFLEKNPDFKGSVGFLITGDEEGPAINGSVKLLKWMQERGEQFDHCLLGEPTNPEQIGDMIKIGRRGSLTGTIVVQGLQGHVAYPERAFNPIPVLLETLNLLTSWKLDEGTEHFGPSNLEITTIDVGNMASNIIPAKAKASFNIRFNDQWTAESLAAYVQSKLSEITEQERITLTFLPSNAPAFLTQPDAFTHQVMAVIESETGLKPALSTTGGTSDARFIKDYGPVLEFGLVGKTMHQIDERVAVADLEMLTRIYGRLLKAYFNTQHQPDKAHGQGP
jgi:succinyl-diaminopimelate desuccinylase